MFVSGVLGSPLDRRSVSHAQADPGQSLDIFESLKTTESRLSISQRTGFNVRTIGIAKNLLTAAGYDL